MQSEGSVTHWIGQLKAGDPAAAQRLWERYFPRLVRLALKKLRGANRRVSDEEDLVLSVFDSFCRGAAHGRFPQLAVRDNLWPLLVAITEHKASDHARHGARQKRGGTRVQGESAFAAAAGSSADQRGIEQVVGREPTPEQASGDMSRIGPASDVYSLGATLYELLTGRPPFRAATAIDTIRQVLDADPVSPRLLNPKVDHDLETITLKCLQKEPTQRYHSSATLAHDLGRYLDHEPIHARPVSVTERLSRWCRRNPRVAALSAVVLVLLVIVAVGSTVGMLVINEKRRQASSLADANHLLADDKTNLAENERKAKEEAQAKRKEAEDVLQYMVNAFRRPDPSLDGYKLTVAEMLANSVKQLDQEFPGQPQIKAALLNAIGETYRGLGLPQEAVEVFEQALSLRRHHLGEDHPDTLGSMHNLALSYYGAGQLDKALPQYEETLKRREEKRGPDHPDTLRSMSNFASACRSAGQLDRASSVLYECLHRCQRTRPDDWCTFETRVQLGTVLSGMKRFDEAEPLLLAGYEGLVARIETIPASERTRLRKALDQIVQLYGSWGEPDKAAEWRAKLHRDPANEKNEPEPTKPSQRSDTPSSQ